MKKRFYPKKYLLLAVFPLIAFAFVTIIYLVGTYVLSRFNLLPLNMELLMSYHILTICLPLSFVIGITYWINSSIVIKTDEIVFRADVTKLKRQRVKMGDIIEICAHEIEAEDSTKKFHIHCTGENCKIIEFWYDEKALIELAKEIKTQNPKVKMNNNLKALIA